MNILIGCLMAYSSVCCYQFGVVFTVYGNAFLDAYYLGTM